MQFAQSTSLVLMLAAAVAAGAPAPPDLTVRTRISSDPRRGAVVETVTLQATASRQRLTHVTDFPDGTRGSSITSILQCDQHRALLLNDLAKLYAVEPEPRPITRSAAMLQSGRGMTITRPNGDVRTIDAVDTGERRVFGPVTARHVVTTTTVERAGVAPRVVAIRDGWYIDAPPRTCDSSGDVATATLFMSRNGGIPEVRWRGRARTGYALEERDRMFESTATLERNTELVEVSGAPIPPAVFDIPDGYQPALPMPGGGHDLTRPDTFANRAAVLWTMAAGWIRSWWQ
jgi:hypothetical protein